MLETKTVTNGPHLEMHSVSLPQHPAVAYLFLVRPHARHLAHNRCVQQSSSAPLPHRYEYLLTGKGLRARAGRAGATLWGKRLPKDPTRATSSAKPAAAVSRSVSTARSATGESRGTEIAPARLYKGGV